MDAKLIRQNTNRHRLARNLGLRETSSWSQVAKAARQSVLPDLAAKAKLPVGSSDDEITIALLRSHRDAKRNAKELALLDS